MTVKRLEERTQAAFKGGKVNREGGYIDGVLICGFESANNREYLQGSFGTGSMYEGRPVYSNHNKEREQRRVEDKIGWFSNVVIEGGKPYGRFNVMKSHSLADMVFEAAERNPALLGMSHIARCKTKRINGKEKIESVQSVESIDLVAEPATTHGFFESQGNTMKISELTAWLGENKGSSEQIGQVKQLAEMEGMGAVEIDAPAGADDAVGGAFKSAMYSIIDMYPDKLDAPGVLSKLKDVMKAHGKMTDKPEPPKKDDAKTDESKKDSDADVLRESIVLVTKHKLGTDKIELLAKIPDAATRESVAKEFAVVSASGGEKPKSSGGDTGGDNKSESAPPVDAKKFAESYK